MDFIEEVKWRGMVHQMMPGTEEKLKEGMTTLRPQAHSPRGRRHRHDRRPFAEKPGKETAR